MYLPNLFQNFKYYVYLGLSIFYIMKEIIYWIIFFFFPPELIPIFLSVVIILN